MTSTSIAKGTAIEERRGEIRVKSKNYGLQDTHE